MQVLVAELTDGQVINRMAQIERLISKVVDEMSTAHTGTLKSEWLIKKYHTSLLFYADIIQEAWYRKLITLH